MKTEQELKAMAFDQYVETANYTKNINMMTPAIALNGILAALKIKYKYKGLLWVK